MTSSESMVSFHSTKNLLYYFLFCSVQHTHTPNLLLLETVNVIHSKNILFLNNSKKQLILRRNFLDTVHMKLTHFNYFIKKINGYIHKPKVNFVIYN